MDKPLPDKLESNARVEVRVDGTKVGTRRAIDFVSSGSNADDGVNDVVTVVMGGGGGGGSEWTINGSGDLAPTTSPVTRDFNVTATRGVNLEGNVSLYSTAQIEATVDGSGNSLLLNTSSGAAIAITSNAALVIESDGGSSNITIRNTGTGSIVINPRAFAGSGYLKLSNLPTSDPGVSTAIWNDSGTLKISP